MQFHVEKTYCKVCKEVWDEDEIDMVQCDKCDFWIHARCDEISNAGLNYLESKSKSYACPSCRSEEPGAFGRAMELSIKNEARTKLLIKGLSRSPMLPAT